VEKALVQTVGFSPRYFGLNAFCTPVCSDQMMAGISGACFRTRVCSVVGIDLCSGQF
jgi:hypothetical protein